MILVLCSCAPNMSYAVPVRHRAPVAWHRVVHTGPKRKISMYFCVAPMAGQILMYRPLLTSKSATASMLMRAEWRRPRRDRHRCLLHPCRCWNARELNFRAPVLTAKQIRMSSSCAQIFPLLISGNPLAHWYRVISLSFRDRETPCTAPFIC
jgi:hypothetical protein